MKQQTNTLTTCRIGWHNQHHSPAWYVCYETLTTTWTPWGGFVGGGGSQGQARALQQGEAQATEPVMVRHYLTTQKSYISWVQLQTSSICQSPSRTQGPNKPVTGASHVTLSFALLPSSKCLMKHDVSEVCSSYFFRQGTSRQSHSLSLGSIMQPNIVGTTEKANTGVSCGQFGTVRLKLLTPELFF